MRCHEVFGSICSCYLLFPHCERDRRGASEASSLHAPSTIAHTHRVRACAFRISPNTYFECAYRLCRATSGCAQKAAFIPHRFKAQSFTGSCVLPPSDATRTIWKAFALIFKGLHLSFRYPWTHNTHHADLPVLREWTVVTKDAKLTAAGRNIAIRPARRTAFAPRRSHSTTGNSWTSKSR